MIRLVTDTARKQLRRLQLKGLKIPVVRLHLNVIGARDRADLSRDAQTPFAARLLPVGLDDLWIDEYIGLLPRRIHDKQTLQDADLRRGKADASRLRFLLVCAKNRAISFSKRQSRIVLIPALPELGSSVHENDALIERMISRALVQKLLGVLDGMDPAYADALFLQLEGASVKQIAKLLGEKPETIKKRLHRARKLLRSAAKEDGGTEE